MRWRIVTNHLPAVGLEYSWGGTFIVDINCEYGYRKLLEVGLGTRSFQLFLGTRIDLKERYGKGKASQRDETID